VVVCSDECYVDVYSSAAPRSILEFGTKNVLAFHSCSKRSGMTGYRTGFTAGDPDLLATLARLRPNIGVATPAFVEAAAAAAWSDDAHAAERREVFGAKRAVLTRFLHEAGMAPVGGDATFFLWFRPPGGDDVAYAQRLLDEGGIVVMPGSYFGAGGEGFCRVALVPDLATCEEAVGRWRELL
jgi:acetylornithine aminotransferase